MRVEHISTGELVRIPRKLAKTLRKQGIQPNGLSKERFYGWEVSDSNSGKWFVVRKVKK